MSAATAPELRVLPGDAEAAEFALRAFVTAHVADSDEADPRALAFEIAAAVPDDQLRVALEQALPRYVYYIVGTARRSVGHENESARWAGVQRTVQSGALAIYRWRISVGDDDWKFFGECSQPEVVEVAKRLKKKALELADQHQRFNAVAKLMEELKAETVEAIPVERLVEIFNA